MTAIDLGAGFTITPVERDGYVCWEVTGSLDLFRSPRLTEVIAAAWLGGQCCHLIDLTAVASLDAAALRDLIVLHKLVQSRGRLVVTASPGSDVWSLLVATGASRILRLSTQCGAKEE